MHLNIRQTFLRARKVIRITPEIIQCNCPECGGDGDWGKFIADNEDLCRALTHSYPYIKGSYPCIECKGTGRIYA